MNHKSRLLWLLLGSAAVALGGCSSTKKNFLAKLYQNTHAYFNGYYHANLRYKEATKTIEKASLPPEEGFLPLVDAANEAPAGPQATLLDEAIKKCEVIILRRPNSDWVDDCRFLIGRCWYYKQQMGPAMQNFQYIPIAFKQSNLVPQAVLWQAKVEYTRQNFTEAKLLLRKVVPLQRSLPRAARQDVALLYATLQVQNKEYSPAIKTLEDNLSYLHGRLHRARAQFLLGQLYDQLGFFPEAYEHYEQAARIDYSDVLTFRARLALVGLYLKYQPEAEPAGVVDKLLAAMLKDTRFTAYQDRILYQRALLAEKRADFPTAIEDLQLALTASKDNGPQKTLTYYRLGQLYFYRLHNLDRAQPYLDSAAVLAKPEMADYKPITRIGKAVEAYGRYKTTIHLSDSLLTLARLSPSQLDDQLAATLEAQDAQQEALAEATLLAQQQAANQLPSTAITASTAQGSLGTFYFDNPVAIGPGRSSFLQTWGQRPLEDNWRRRNKERSQLAVTPASNAQPDTARTSNKPLSFAQRKAALLKTVPRDSAALHSTQRQLGEAMNSLAQLYADQLGLPDSAIATYRAVSWRFPHSEHQARAYYGLYRLLKPQPEAKEVAAAVLKNYPETIFAEIIRAEQNSIGFQPNDLESSYAVLYALYNTHDYATVVNLAGYLQQHYPADSLQPKLLYLQGLAYGRQLRYDSLKATFARLAQLYPATPQAQLAQQTLQALNHSKVPIPAQAAVTTTPIQPSQKNTSTTTGVVSPATTNDVQQAFTTTVKPGEYVIAVVLCQKGKVTPAALKAAITKFNDQNIGPGMLEVEATQAGDHIIGAITRFSDFTAAARYLDAMPESPDVKKYLTNPDEQLLPFTPASYRLTFLEERWQGYAVWWQQQKAGVLGQPK